MRWACQIDLAQHARGLSTCAMWGVFALGIASAEGSSGCAWADGQGLTGSDGTRRAAARVAAEAEVRCHDLLNACLTNRNHSDCSAAGEACATARRQCWDEKFIDAESGARRDLIRAAACDSGDMGEKQLDCYRTIFFGSHDDETVDDEIDRTVAAAGATNTRDRNLCSSGPSEPLSNPAVSLRALKTAREAVRSVRCVESGRLFPCNRGSHLSAAGAARVSPDEVLKKDVTVEDAIAICKAAIRVAIASSRSEVSTASLLEAADGSLVAARTTLLEAVARQRAEARAQREADARAQREAEARAQREAEEKRRLEQEARNAAEREAGVAEEQRAAASEEKNLPSSIRSAESPIGGSDDRRCDFDDCCTRHFARDRAIDCLKCLRRGKSYYPDRRGGRRCASE